MGTNQEENGGASAGYRLPAVAWGMDDGEPEGVSGAASVAEPVPVPAPAPAPAPASVPESAGSGGPGLPAAARLVALKRAIAQAPARAARTLASVAPSAAGPAATGTGTTSAAPGAPAAPASTDEAGALEPAGERTGRRRVPRPAVAAAAVGVVLMGLPLVMGRGEAGTDAVEQLGGTGTSRPDAPAPEPDAPATPPGTPAATASPAGGPTSPGGAPTDPAATPAPGTPAPGTPAQQPVPAAAGAPIAQAGGPAPAVRTGNGAADRPAAGSQPGTAPQAPAQPAAQPPAQPSAPQPAPQPQQPPAAVPPPAPPAPPSYTGYAGPGCASSSTGYSENGRSAGSRDWVTNYDGGTDCGGDYTSVPMSGDRSKDDGNSVVWSFFASPVTSGSCRISVYIPNNGDIKAVGGAPAYYTVQNGTSPGSGTIGSFSVNQPQHQGQWVSAGTYPLSGGRIAVMLHTRGIDWGSTTGAHLAASTVKADCTG